MQAIKNQETSIDTPNFPYKISYINFTDTFSPENKAEILKKMNSIQNNDLNLDKYNAEQNNLLSLEEGFKINCYIFVGEVSTEISQILNTIENISCITPKGAFYAFPNIFKTGKSSSKLQCELLEKAGVATLAGVSFGKRGEGFLRISYANSLEKIEAAINRIESYFSC